MIRGNLTWASTIFTIACNVHSLAKSFRICRSRSGAELKMACSFHQVSSLWFCVWWWNNWSCECRYCLTEAMPSYHRTASSEFDPMVALTPMHRRTDLNALPRKVRRAMSNRLFHSRGRQPDGEHGNSSQHSRSRLEYIKNPRITQAGKDNAQSGPCEASLGEGTLQEVPHPQRVGPVTQIG